MMSFSDGKRGDAKKSGESRQFGRRETNYTGWIRIAGKPSRMCLVRNISLGGARLECELPRSLPFQFDLFIPATGSNYTCEVRHQSDTAVGVEFQTAALADSGPSPAVRQRDAETWGDAADRPVRAVDSAVAALRSGRSKSRNF